MIQSPLLRGSDVNMLWLTSDAFYKIKYFTMYTHWLIILSVQSWMYVYPIYHSLFMKGSHWIRLVFHLVFAHPFPLNSRAPIASANFISDGKVQVSPSDEINIFFLSISIIHTHDGACPTNGGSVIQDQRGGGTIQSLSSLTRVCENFLPLIGHFVWRSWGSSSDILGFRQSFYTENGQQIWLLCWTFCLPTQELLVRHFQNSSDMSEVTDGFREAWVSPLLVDTNFVQEM